MKYHIWKYFPKEAVQAAIDEEYSPKEMFGKTRRTEYFCCPLGVALRKIGDTDVSTPFSEYVAGYLCAFLKNKKKREQEYSKSFYRRIKNYAQKFISDWDSDTIPSMKEIDI